MIRAQTRRHTLQLQRQHTWPGWDLCGCTSTHRQLRWTADESSCGVYKALYKLFRNSTVKHHTNQTGQGNTWRPLSCWQVNWFGCVYTQPMHILIPLCFWENPDQDIFLFQWQHSCQQYTYWSAWCLFACCVCLLPPGHKYPILTTYFSLLCIWMHKAPHCTAWC